LEKLSAYIGNEKFAIIDTGGHFSHVMHDLQLFFGSNLIGIVEDTENEHQKYEAALLTNENEYEGVTLSLTQLFLWRVAL
jgi:hypothetical protein